MESDGRNHRKASSSTEPLVTDSCSDSSNDMLDEIKVKSSDSQRVAGRMRGGYTKQWGYDTKKLNRLQCRREHELEEFNFGINFALLKTSKEQQARLRLFLRKKMNELNEYVEKGTGPIFGFPPICYSPPAELVKKLDGDREYVKVLMRHIF